MKTTTIGQISLLMLIEKLFINDFEVISANTDGVVVLLKKSRIREFEEIQRNWEDETKLNLSQTNYDKLVMSNVNNYLAIKSGDKPVEERVKLKGWFEMEKLPHKNHSMAIIAKALHDYFVYGNDYKDTVYKCEDINMFLKAVKAKSGGKLELHDILSKTQTVKKLDKTVRYYVSNPGFKLLKILPPLKESVYINTLFDGTFQIDRKIEIESGYLISYANNLNEINTKKNKINYDYYIKNIERIIRPIKNKRA